MNKPSSRFLIAFGVTSCLLAGPAFGAVIATESFGYSAGALGTANGGTGWTTAWAGGSTNVTSPGLTFATLGIGNKLTTNNDNNGAFRSLATLGTDGTTLWLAYLASGPGAPVMAGYAGLSLFSGGTELLFTGKRTNQTTWGLQRSGGGQGGDSVVTADTLTHYLVFRLEFGAGLTAGNERVTMWMDPTPGLAAPDVAPSVTLTDVTNFTFDRIRVQSGNGSSFNADEIRVATSYSEVPEPSIASGLALAAVGLLGCRRRRD
jgi:hypothetical protein